MKTDDSTESPSLAVRNRGRYVEPACVRQIAAYTSSGGRRQLHHGMPCAQISSTAGGSGGGAERLQDEKHQEL